MSFHPNIRRHRRHRRGNICHYFNLELCHFNYSLSLAYVRFLTQTLLLTISVVFTLFGHCLNTKICQFSFQNLGFSFPESHQVDIFQGMTQNFTPHINLITTKTPAITLLYTLLLSPISLLGNQTLLASAHSFAPLHNSSSLSRISR